MPTLLLDVHLWCVLAHTRPNHPPEGHSALSALLSAGIDIAADARLLRLGD
jgi:hypothetical protein